MEMKLDVNNPFPIKNTASHMYDHQTMEAEGNSPTYNPSTHISSLNIGFHSFDRVSDTAASSKHPQGFHEWFQPCYGAKDPTHFHKLREGELTIHS